MINRLILSEQVKAELLNDILKGKYQPGDRLVESQIAKEMGISQSPVREALRDLVAMRFVEVIPYKGARVRMVDPNELAEIYPVRASLEELAGQLAAPRLKGHVEELESIYDAMVDAAGRNDVHELAAHDASFHKVIVNAAGNRILADTWASLMIETRTFVTTVRIIISDHGLQRVAEMHRPIIDVLKSGNAKKAGAEMRAHVETFGKLIRKGDPNGTNSDRSVDAGTRGDDDVPASTAAAD